MNYDKAMYARGRAAIRGFVHVVAIFLGLLLQMTLIRYGGGSAMIEAISFARQILKGESISFASWLLVLGVAGTILSLLLSLIPGRFGRQMLIGSLAATAWVIFVAVSTSGASLVVLASSIPLIVAGGIGWVRLGRFPKPISVAGVCQGCGYRFPD